MGRHSRPKVYWGNMRHQISWRSVQPLLELSNFSIFENGGRPPLWSCYMLVWTTREEYWWYLSLCKIWLKSMQCASFNILRVCFENAYSRPQTCFLGELTSYMESSVNVTPREKSTKKPKHVTCHMFAQTTHVCRNATWIYTFHVSSKSVQGRRGHVGVTKFGHSHYFGIGSYNSLY